jgi:hypothetical protein
MADQLSKGARVRWKAGRGSVTGTVERVITGRAKVGSRTVAGSKDDPRYVVKNAETGKTTVLKRSSLTKVGGRAAKPKAATGAKRPSRSEAPAAEASPAVPASASTLRHPSPVRRWMAPAALLAVVAAVVAIIVFAGGDDDGDDGDVTVATAPATETTSTETQTDADPSGPASASVVAAVDAGPFEMRGVDTIAAQRLGDEQERLESQFDRTYRDVLAGLEEVEQAAAADSESAEAESVAALATYLTQEVQIDQAITAAFVENSFADGDSAAVLSEKTAGTESTLRNQVDAAAGLTAPSEAEDVRDAFAAIRKANLGYLIAVGNAIDAGDQAALDQALRDGEAAAARAGRRLAAAATALQEETETTVSG